jgi:hypothetical protein
MQQLGLKTYGDLYTSNWDYYNIETGAAETSQWGFYSGWCTLTFNVTDTTLYNSIETIGTTSYSLVSKSDNTVTINFGNLQNVVSTRSDDGARSTNNLFFHTNSTYESAGTDGEGLMKMLQIAFALMRSDKATLTSGDINTVMKSAIVRAAQYNQFTLTSCLGESVPTTDKITLWYLPSTSEVTSSTLLTNGTYWSSTGYSDNSNSTYGAYIYTSSGTTSQTTTRSPSYYIHAVRATTNVTK